MLPYNPWTIKRKQNRIVAVPGTFERACETRMVDKLRKVEPFGQTSMRDAVDYCLSEITNFTKLGLTDHSYKLIVVTDGYDNASTLTASKLSRNLEALTQGRSIDNCNIIFITLDLEKHEQANLDLIGICHNSINYAKLFEVETVKLENVLESLVFRFQEFTHVAVNLKQEDNSEEMRIVYQQAAFEAVKQKDFAVTFCLDISGSMTENNKWNLLINTVDSIVKKLARNQNNFVDCVLFSNYVLRLNHPHFGKVFEKKMTDSCFSCGPMLCMLCVPFCAYCIMQELAHRTATGVAFNWPRFICCTFCGPIGVAYYRSRIREAYNISGNGCYECLLASVGCCCCMTAQEWMESRYRGQSLYLI
jgi:hypothetical protein